MLSIKTILHPTDFSEPSGSALDLASGLAADYGASLFIVHVIPAPFVLSDGVIFPGPERGQAGVHEKLDGLQVPDDGVNVIRRVEEGNAATEILNMAQLCHADLIVMGSHGRHGLRRLLMGSVAEAVMRKANCPVLTVNTQIATRSPSIGLTAHQAAHV